MMMFSLILFLSLSITALTLHSPALLAFNILLMAFSLVMNMVFLASSWYALMVFLMYIGGMLVMFAYFVVITPNQKYMSGMSYMVTLLSSMALLYMPLYLMNKTSKTEMIYKHHFSFQPTEILSSTYAPMTALMILYLLLTMLIVVKIVAYSKGPMRPFKTKYV